MSESKPMGRCRSEVDDRCGSPCELVIAGAIDRLAADVAEVREAVCDGSVAEERDRFLAGMAAAIRERDEARALLELAQVQRTAAYADRDEARAEVYRLKCGMTETSKERDEAIRERDEARAEVEKMRMQLAACGVLADCNTTDSLERSRQMHPGYDCASVRSVIRAAEREIGLLAEVERLKNELYDREQEILSLRADTVERYDPPAAPQPEPVSDAQPAAPPAWWLTGEETAQFWFTLDRMRRLGYPPAAAAVEGILARAGSPPVVEVPAMTAGGWLRTTHLRYRAAMDRAGVAWKEVGRE